MLLDPQPALVEDPNAEDVRDIGVPAREVGVVGVRGVPKAPTLSLPLATDGRDPLRDGVILYPVEDVDLPIEEDVRDRKSEGGPLVLVDRLVDGERAVGDWTSRDSVGVAVACCASGFPASSCHFKCRMTDFVAQVI